MITISIWFAVILVVFSVFGFMAFLALSFALWYVKHNGTITISYKE